MARSRAAVAMFSGNASSAKWLALRRLAGLWIAVGLILLIALHLTATLLHPFVLAGLATALGTLLAYLATFFDIEVGYHLSIAVIPSAAVMAVLSSGSAPLWMVLVNGAAGFCLLAGLGSIAVTWYLRRFLPQGRG